MDKLNQEVIHTIYVNLEDGIRAFQTKDVLQKDALKKMREGAGMNEILQKDLKVGQVLLKALED